MKYMDFLRGAGIYSCAFLFFQYSKNASSSVLGFISQKLLEIYRKIWHNVVRIDRDDGKEKKMSENRTIIDIIKDKLSSFSIKMFVLIAVCVVMPLSAVCIYVEQSMETVLQNKISERILQNIFVSEKDILKMFQSMAILSNTFALDEELLERMQDRIYTEYENVQYFNRLVDKMIVTSTHDLADSAKITILEQAGRVYSNWSLNYQDYKFLLEEDWVKEAKEAGGYMSWSMFSPAYVTEDHAKGKTYISLARALLSQGTVGKSIGMLIISIEQSKFSDLLKDYTGPEDEAFICIKDGEVLFSANPQNIISQEQLKAVYKQMEGKKYGEQKQKIGAEEYLISYYTLPEPWLFGDDPMKIFIFTNYKEVTSSIEALTNKMNGVIAISIMLVILLTYVSIKMLVKPIGLLTEKMKEYTLEQEITGIDIRRKDEIGHLNRAFVRMSDNIKSLFAKLDKESREKEQYRYESLRAQLNPHFLFNTLTSIRWMALIRGADNIVDSIDALASVLKYSLSRSNEEVTLKDELENIKNFIYIHNLRYQDQCVLELDSMDEIEDLKMMKFILQPVVENSIIHGMDKNKKELNIRVYGYIEEETLLLFVEDNGIGITKEAVEKFASSKNGGRMTGIGLKNVDTCIRMTYGEQYGLTIEGMKQGGTCVTYRLPILRGRCDDETADDCR